MKRKILLVVLTVFVCLYHGSVVIFAENTDFSMEEMEADTKESILSNIDLSFLTEEPKKNAIIGFDVNDEGWLVVGMEDFYTKKTIAVYAENGTFQYGYTFDTKGSFRVGWHGGNLMVAFVRGGSVLLLDAKGTVVEMKKISDTMENDAYWRNTFDSSRREVGESVYTMENNRGIFNILASDYALIIKTDAEGNRTAVYDVSGTDNVKFFIMLIVLILAVTAAGIAVAFRVIKAVKNTP